MTDLVGRTSVGVMQVLELDEAVARGLDVPPGATRALISVHGKARWRDDGMPPTASQGHSMVDEYMFYGGPLTTIKFIAQAGPDAVVTASFYR